MYKSLLHLQYKLYLNISVYLVLDKTLKGIRGVQLDNQKVLCAPGPWTKCFERLFYCLINYNYIFKSI